MGNFMAYNKEDLIKYRIERSQETIIEAQKAIKEGHYFLAANRIYYAMFYVVSALAIKEGFITSKHHQLLGWFNKNYVKNGIINKDFGKIYRDSFEKRMEGDYDDFVTFTSDEINQSFSRMKSFIEEIIKLINI